MTISQNAVAALGQQVYLTETITVPIDLVLATRTKTPIHQVHAHPAAAAQADTWLTTHHPNHQIVPANSNAAAAATAADTNTTAVTTPTAASNLELAIIGTSLVPAGTTTTFAVLTLQPGAERHFG